MRTDTIFYKLFQTFPTLLFELIGQPPEVGDRYEFSSREIKELAKRFDGLFLPVTDDENLLIYFLEVQFQPKSDFYWRFFSEIFVYLGQYQPKNDWRAVAVFASRSLDPGMPRQYRWLRMTDSVGGSPPVRIVYLDELQMPTTSSIGLATVKLVVGDDETAVSQAKQLVQKVRREFEDAAIKQKVVELIETILIYKLPHLTRKEIEAMFELEDLKNTRYFQDVAEEAKEQGKLESVPGLLALGLTVEQIAGALKLDVEMVRQAGQNQEAIAPSEAEATGI